jgi:hypothetical protein
MRSFNPAEFKKDEEVDGIVIEAVETRLAFGASRAA